MRRLFAALALTLLATTSWAAPAGDGRAADSDRLAAKDGKKAAAAADDDDEGEDDDILAPVRGEGERTPTVVPVKDRATKVGLLPLVAIGDAGKPLADQLTTELLKAFNESAQVEVKALGLDAAAGAVSIDVGAANDAKKAGDEQLEKGRQQLGKLQFGKAKKAFQAAVTSYEKAASVLESPTPLIEAWLGLAEVAARQAQDDETKRCFAVVVAYNPELELDRKRFPGLFVTTHRKVRDQLLKGPRAGVFVDESGTGAAVTVDGRQAKSAPARITGLLPGAHLVRALREGLPAWGAVVTVEAEAEAEATASPGFLEKGRKGPADDLSRNRLSPEAAGVVAEAARQQELKAGVVGVVSKDGGRAVVQLVYVDAASGKTALLPATAFSPSLLDVGIEALKSRGRMEELATADAPAVQDADEEEALIEGARAGAAVTVSEVALKYNVKVSKETTSRKVGDDDDDDDRAAESDGDGERGVAENTRGSRKTLDGDKDPYARTSSDEASAEDGSLTSQPWFMPTMITVGVVGAVALVGGTAAALIGFGVVPDPRPADGAQVNITLPTSSSATQ
jgi:hypothetical protein